jgi:N-acetylglucosaminyldiphosphoundecaprenol N-acetyl-beta-D-mannosaminyltransferase
MSISTLDTLEATHRLNAEQLLARVHSEFSVGQSVADWPGCNEKRQPRADSLSAPRYPVSRIWGVDFSALTSGECLYEAERLIEQRVPQYVITANLHYLMLSSRHRDLAEINRNAAMILADGMPVVWRSRLTSQRIPERIAGSDLIYSIASLAGQRRYRVYFLGGADGVAARTAEILSAMYPGLIIAGTESPVIDELKPHEQAELVLRIRDAQPDILLAALGQPKGERWIARWHRQMQVPLSIQLGGSFNFVTGRIHRSPDWMSAAGLEWAHRLCCEPQRLAPRYLRNAGFLLRCLINDLTGSTGGS